MIDFIEGIVEEITEDKIIISTGVVGFALTASDISRSSVEVDKEYKIFTEMRVREDDITLYGFVTRDERKVFNLLTTVSGVGAKVGMGILSAISLNDIRMAIATSNVKALTKAPGIGKKTAERLILELKDKMGTLDLTNAPQIDIHEEPADEAELIDALMSLGYNRYESIKASADIDSTLDLSSKIRIALSNLSR